MYTYIYTNTHTLSVCLNQQVIAELRRFKGDKTQATAALFAKALKF
jgi:hypothetical protein